MHFTHFTIMQDGKSIGNATSMEQAVSKAKAHAADTGKPVSVTAHVEGGGSREAVLNPDGTNEKIWSIDKGRPLIPVIGQVYINRGGGKYRCTARLTATGPVYYNQAGGSSNTSGIFQNIESGWTFIAKGLIQYADGTIEWDHSCDGHFEDIVKGK